ncbi:hypothetical protein [uncultured Mailhella sp.]|uniref:hypothetical protein n=1 Tax=uncultured Mailhella sp. TaxID=1981031 RepID=UPI00262F6309|nr:hypothetical protein [uncultured Mailhella sp.]
MDKPLGKITLEEVQTWCKENDDCPGCPCYTKENACVFARCAEAAEWPLNTEQEAPSAAEDTNVPDKPGKPRLAEVLGVEVGERFRMTKFSETVDCWVDTDGWMHHKNGLVRPEYVIDAINHPESIIRAPRLTEAELERCRVYGAKWVSKDPVKNTVNLWREKPELTVGDIFTSLRGPEATANDYLFPSVRCGCCIQAEEERVEEA